MNPDKIKQIIVVRKDLKNTEGHKVRTGKLIAQACHASISFLTKRLQKYPGIEIPLSKEEQQWIKGSFLKVCLAVDNEEQLLDVYNKARNTDVEVHLITDAGNTEFGGVPTNTCLAIGPDKSSIIDPITNHLNLF